MNEEEVIETPHLHESMAPREHIQEVLPEIPLDKEKIEEVEFKTNLPENFKSGRQKFIL